MSRKILTAVLLLFAASIVAAPQTTHTFCALDTACTIIAQWNFTGGLQNNGVPVLTNPVNLATQVTGTLSGANYAAVNLAAGNVNGGVTGVLPGSNMAATNLAGGNNPGGVTGILPLANLTTQGTDTSLLTSGTISASTGVALCTDANHGATTSGCAAGGVTESVIGWGAQAAFTLSAASATCPTVGTQPTCPETVYANAHTVVRFTYVLSGSSPAGCSTLAVLGVKDNTSGTVLTSLSIANSQATGFTDSGAVSVATTAGHRIGVGLTTAPSGCSTFPTIANLQAVLQ